MSIRILLDGGYLYKTAPWLTWNEILYGLNRGFINNKDVVDYAFLKLDAGASFDEVELASLSEGELYQVPDVLDRLASGEDGQDIVLESWLYLLLLWVYDHRNNFDDPFCVIEEIYSDFDYPEGIAPIVRYAPLPSGEVGGDEYLYENWLKIVSLYRKKLEELHGCSSS